MAIRTDVKVVVTAVTASASKALKSLGNDLKDMGVKTKDAKIAAVAVSAAITGAGIGFVSFAKNAAFASARIGELELALGAMSKATGISDETINDTVQGLRDLNIANRQALESVGLMITAEIDLSKATELARTAQDLAVVASIDSSEALKTLTTAIATQRPVLLRQFGITKTLDQIYKDFADDTGMVTEKTKGLGAELTEAQKKAAFMNAILKQGGKVAGVYESAMGSVSKRFRSLTGRIIPDFMATVGRAFEPALIELVDVFSETIKDLTRAIEEGDLSFENLGNTLTIVAEGLGFLLGIAVTLVETFLGLPSSVQTITLGLIALVPLVTTLGISLGVVNAGLAVLGITLSTIAVPLLAVGAAVGVVALAWPTMKTNMEESINFWKETVIPGFIDGVANIGNSLLTFIETELAQWKIGWDEMPMFLGLVFGAVEGTLNTFREETWPTFLKGLKATQDEWHFKMLTGWGFFKKGIGVTVEDIKSNVIKTKEDMFAVVMGLLDEWRARFKATWEITWNDVIQFLRDTIKPKIVSWLGDTLEKVRRWAVEIGTKIEGVLRKVSEGREIGRTLGIQGFQTGGVVSGPVGSPQLAVVHGGETVLPTGTGGVSGAGKVEINLNVGTFVGTETEKRTFAEDIYNALLEVALTQNKTVAELMGG